MCFRESEFRNEQILFICFIEYNFIWKQTVGNEISSRPLGEWYFIAVDVMMIYIMRERNACQAVDKNFDIQYPAITIIIYNFYYENNAPEVSNQSLGTEWVSTFNTST